MGSFSCIVYYDITKMVKHPNSEILRSLIRNGFLVFFIVWENVHDIELTEKQDIKVHLHHEYKCKF